MEKLVIQGGGKLSGDVKISSAKNAILPIIAATLLIGDKCIITNTPLLEDVFVMSDILKSINSNVSIDKNKLEMVIDNSNLINSLPNSELAKKLRASFLIMGPMIARFGRFKISLPGGCNIGTRPIDLHLKGLNALGAEITVDHGHVEAHASRLIGSKIYLDFPSVGATENIMMAAVYADGETIIENSAAEPEIEDLAIFLNNMGANIQGAGTDTITITGVKDLKGTSHRPIFDRIEAGTFIVAAAISKSKIKLTDVREDYLKPIIAKLAEMGVQFEAADNGIIVDGSGELRPVDIKTMPYPGFPTDMQSQMMTLLSTIKGSSVITETIFESRYMYVSELNRMGANIKIDGRSAFIEGVEKLAGADVKATDLRAGAALILAGLAAEGVTEITDIYHIDRGYEKIEKKFQGLGLDIIRKKY